MRPAVGRFLQADPADYYDAANLYAYVGNDPINRLDPNGEFIFAIVAVVVAVVEVVSAVADIVNAVETVADPSASTTEKVAAVAGAVATVVLPGGGYGTAASRGGGALAKAIERGHIWKGKGARSLDKLARALDISREKLRAAIHALKAAEGLPGDVDVHIDMDNGNVYNPSTGDLIGNVKDG